MRILIAVHHFPPRHLAGAELRAFEQARWLLAHGHDVQVVCVDAVDEPAADGLRVYEDRVEGVPVSRLSFDLGQLGDPLLASYANPLIERFLDGLLARGRFDLVHLISGYLLGLGPIRAARRAGLPIVVTLTDYWFICPTIQLLKGSGALCPGPRPLECARCLADRQRRYRLLDERWPGLMRRVFELRARHLPGQAGFRADLERLGRRQVALLEALNSVDAVISPTQFLRDMFVRNGVRADRIAVIAQALDRELAPPAAGRPAGPVGTPFRIGYLGQLAPVKGVALLLRAFRRLEWGSRARALELHILGDPRPFPRYAARLRALAGRDPRIRFRGRYERAELPALIQQLDLVVVPSIWYENSPQVITEAFLYGRPVVATRLGGMAELVRDEVDGLLFERGSEADLAAQLRRVVEDGALYERLRRNIRPVRPLGNELLELIGLFERLVGKPTPATEGVTRP